MEFLSIFFFLGLAFFFFAIFFAFTMNLASIMRGPERANVRNLIKCLGFILLFALVVASLVTRIIFVLRTG
jgi:uncharacterized membrane protein